MAQESVTIRAAVWRGALAGAAAEFRRTDLAAGAFRLAREWLLCLAALFLIDLVFGPPPWVRWLLLAVQVGLLGWRGLPLFLLWRRPPNSDAWAARRLEQLRPDLDNALIHAVQFEAVLPGAVGLASRLMQREVARAEQRPVELPLSDPEERARSRRALHRFLIVLGGWILFTLAFPGVVSTVLPRLFLPWLDHLTPPFSLTRFSVHPPGATVRAGESLTVRIEVTGPAPDRVELVSKTRASDWRRVTLESVDPRRYESRLESLQEDTWFYVAGAGARSPQYRIRVLTPPRLKNLRATYHAPEYTRRPPLTEPVGDDGIRGLRGTRVLLQVAATRPLRGAALLLRTNDGRREVAPLTPDPKDPTQATGGFTLLRGGRFTLTLESVDGQTEPEAGRGPLTIEKDERPTVVFRQPGQDVLVTPTMSVELLVEAEDDVGLKRVELHRVINELGDSPVDLPSQAVPPQQVEHRIPLELAALGVRPGDEIRYHAIAYDTDPASPNLGQSEVYSIRVVTDEEYREALAERTAEEVADEPRSLEAALQDLAGRQKELADRLEKLAAALKENPDDARARTELERARAEQKALQQEAERLAKDLAEYARSPSTSELEAALKAQFGSLARQLRAAAAGAMGQAQQGAPDACAAAAEKAARELAALDRRAEQTVGRALEHLEKVYPLYQDLARFKALLDRQGQLVLRARALEHRAGNLTRSERALLAELEQEQHRIRSELEQLQGDLRQHAEEAEAFFPRAARSARRIADEITRRRIPALMEEARSFFRSEVALEALARAREAFEQMEAMVAECEAAAGSAGMPRELDLQLTRILGRPGLGRSLSSFGRPGMGAGRGSGIGSGTGGQFGGPAGQADGFSMRTARAYVPVLASGGGGGGPTRRRSRRGPPGREAARAESELELAPNAHRDQPRAPDAPGRGYPIEYRRLVGEYFEAIAERQAAGAPRQGEQTHE